MCCLLISASAWGETIKLDQNKNARYLDKTSLETAILALQNLAYPLTRSEILTSLHLADRQLPSLVVTDSDSARLLLEDHELIDLTDSGKNGRSYRLLLWYDRSARRLSGDSFVNAKIINYAEILVEDDGSADAPKAKYILQSPRYPYVKLDHPKEAPTRKEANQ